MQDKCTKLHLLRQVHVLQGFVPATSREKERMTDVSPPPSLWTKAWICEWMKRQSGKKPSRFNLVVLSSGVQIYMPDCARLKQRTCGEVKSKKTSTEREEGCEDHMSVGVHCVCVCVCSVKWNGRWWWKNKMWETTQVNC